MIFFLDESGGDFDDSPCEVLCAVAISENHIWNLIQAIDGLEKEHFGVNLHSVNVEFKGSNLLKPKRFRHAEQCPRLKREIRRDLTRQLLNHGFAAKKTGEHFTPKSEELAAFGQACIAFVSDLITVSGKYSLRAFAAIVKKGSERPQSGFLRKDYRFMLQRFSDYLNELPAGEMGLLVFDETERKKSRQLLNEMQLYCSETMAGYKLSNRLVPSPFFVHSDLTPVVQLADIFAYCINWGLRLGRMTEPCRPELVFLGNKINQLEWRGFTTEEITDRRWTTHGIFYITDLSDKYEFPKSMKENEEKKGDTKYPPKNERLKSDRRPKPPVEQLPLFPDASNDFRTPIKKSGSLEI